MTFSSVLDTLQCCFEEFEMTPFHKVRVTLSGGLWPNVAVATCSSPVIVLLAFLSPE